MLLISCCLIHTHVFIPLLDNPLSILHQIEACNIQVCKTLTAASVTSYLSSYCLYSSSPTVFEGTLVCVHLPPLLLQSVASWDTCPGMCHPGGTCLGMCCPVYGTISSCLGLHPIFGQDPRGTSNACTTKKTI